jgi:hypothetical protein
MRSVMAVGAIGGAVLTEDQVLTRGVHLHFHAHLAACSNRCIWRRGQHVSRARRRNHRELSIHDPQGSHGDRLSPFNHDDTRRKCARLESQGWAPPTPAPPSPPYEASRPAAGGAPSPKGGTRWWRPKGIEVACRPRNRHGAQRCPRGSVVSSAQTPKKERSRPTRWSK